jgi:hypothetical protein
MNFDPEDLPKFEVPSKLFDKIYEFSGPIESARGVLFAYLTQDGTPLIYARYGSKVVEFGLRKAMESYLQEAEDTSSVFGIDMDGDEGIEES